MQTRYAESGAALATFFNSNTSDDFNKVGDYITVRRDGGGLFQFRSVDWATRRTSGSDNLGFVGRRGGSELYAVDLTANTSLPTTFQTMFSNQAVDIDELRIVVTRDGTNGRFLDNLSLTVSTVPEPSTCGLVALAAAHLAFRRSRRRRA